MIDKKKQGKRNRAAGKSFEKKVRDKLEMIGWTVAKWSNNVDLSKDKLVPVKPKYNPFTKSVVYVGTGFPDYIAFALCPNNVVPLYDVMGVECKGGNKSNKYLSATEKEKCKWLLDKKIFSRILIAQKGEKRGEIIFEEFER